MIYDTSAIIKLTEKRSANEILDTKMPKAIKRFNRYCKQLEKLQNEIRDIFPDTKYFYDDGLNLMLGDHIEANDSSGLLIAETGDIGHADGGGF